MASVETITALKGMASDPKKRSFLLKDLTCIGGLIMVLSNPDVKVVTVALETLLLLADRADHRSTLRDFLGMTDQLETIMRRSSYDKKASNLAEKLYVTLTQVDLQTPLKDTFNRSTVSGQSSKKSSTSKNNRSVLNGRAKHIILQIRGLIDKADRELVMRLLLQVKGVVSITFDLNKKRCILRTKQEVKPETLVQAVSKSQTMIAQQVIKDDNGEEMLLSFGSNHQEMDKENTTLPDYLPDEVDSPVHNGKTLARVGNDGDNKSSGWLSTAASFLTNSFYW
ncbi:armadillo repeat-containing protein 1-like [Mizuhopecten yessoensis]|uniref:Armadillo repeat-containing protein 1 n=1 Tax=Mizuhopecten yessoensis TaxID=6573 RepID=A0A210QYH9_MIZYE|nr:armadillo repeat-containing protein 1-like [Mizuhopecten yessoensis]OWF53786.1 Armadillo repeat-containing protein 1 [Mizuhopecten yessoensis]